MILSYYWCSTFVFACEGSSFLRANEISVSDFDNFYALYFVFFDIVEQKLAAQIAEKFAILVSGWVLRLARDIAVFLSSWADLHKWFETRNLLFSIAGDEFSLGAKEHVSFILFTLKLYKMLQNSAVRIFWDNCNGKKSLFGKMNFPIHGCSNHRLNLAIQDHLQD